MQKARFLIYLVFTGLVFVVFTAIKFILPHPEPKKEIDEIGMRLYKPIFFGESDAVSQFQSDMDSNESESMSSNDEVDTTEPIEKPPSTKTSSVKSGNNSTYLNGLIQEYRQTVLSKRKYRNDVVVRYYRHEPDGDQIKVLSEFGFYIHERPIPDENRFKKFGSNVIYYGHDFPESDLKFIAALLISRGMEIKNIQPFKDFDGWKHKSIEIGANSKLDKKKPLSLEDIQAFKMAR
jgi:hypothetical protein